MLEKTGVFGGSALAFDGMAAASISVRASSDAAAGEIHLRLTADTQDELDSVEVEEGEEAVVSGGLRGLSAGNVFFGDVVGGHVVSGGSISIVNGRIDGVDVQAGRGRSGEASGRRLTLKVEAVVPEGFPLRMKAGGGTRIDADTRGGPLFAELSGQADSTFGEASSVRADVSGQASAHIRSCGPKCRLSASGQSHILLARVDGGAVEASSSGQAGIEIDSGQAESLTADASGQSSIKARIIVGDADLQASGMGKVSLSAAEGIVRESKSGMGEIKVKRRPSPAASSGKAGEAENVDKKRWW